ncbi:MAG TPA: serine--tRNA ligase [Candidatus Paceibacterota bacterium]|jgi:seryl-tRNA synthetase|nr:serine--tRNA ligase [Candidatus Paceibacterota bacterium]HRZ29920.1 serine--tRNA ligase [Candidatus Paceibacterota bacterium]
MLDIKFIKENIDLIKNTCESKGIKLDVEKLVNLDEQKRQLQVKIETIRAKRNEINDRMKSTRDDDLIKQSKILKDELNTLEESFKTTTDDFESIYFRVPNVVSKNTPIGKDSESNVIIKTVGNIPKFNFITKDHIELGLALNILDLEKGTKVHGFRGYYLKNEGAMLHMAILNYAFEKVIKKGFQPFITPSLVKGFNFFGSGFFPYLKDEVYKIANDEDTYLAGTSELSLLGYYQNEIIDPVDLPIKVCAFSPCFRSEAGSYGKDTKGLYRIHEFSKIEQVVICENNIEKSHKYFEEMLSVSEEIMKELKLPYRVVNLCTGDMGAGKYYANDIETYMPSRNGYGETHSCSNLTD